MSEIAVHATHWLPRMLWRIFLGVLGLLIASAILLWLAGEWTDYSAFRRDLTKYQGVAIGESRDEVVYALGTPQTVSTPTGNNPDVHSYYEFLVGSFDPVTADETDLPNTQWMPKGKTIGDFNNWAYYSVERSLMVSYDKNGKVIAIQCYASYRKESRSCDLLFAVSSFTDEDGVTEQLGTPSSEQVSDGVKSMHYDAIGVRYKLHERKVYSITKVAPRNWYLLPWWLKHRSF